MVSGRVAMTSALLARSPGIRLVMAQEILLRRLSIWIDSPDYMSGEEALIQTWSSAVPDAFIEAEQYTKNTLGDRNDWKGYAVVRLAACRRAYATFFGSETHHRLYELGGEAVLALKLGNGGIAKLGAVAVASYKPDPRRWSEYLLWRETEQVISTYEKHLLNGWGEAATQEEWLTLTQYRSEAKPFKDWNKNSHLPSLLTTQIFDARTPPEGLTLRDGVPEAVFAGGGVGVIDILHAIGVCAFVTEPARIYIEEHDEEIHHLANEPKLVGLFAGQTS